jgi:hypothetical protein
MPKIGQKVDFIYKKLIAQKGNVLVNNTGTDTDLTTIAYHQEAFNSKQTITAEQIWTQSKFLPKLTNPLNFDLTPASRTLRAVSSGDLYDESISVVAPGSVDRPILVVNGKNILQRLDLKLTYVPYSKSSWAYQFAPGSAEWLADFGSFESFKGFNIIPFSFDHTSTIYRYGLYTARTEQTDPVWGTSYTLSSPISYLDSIDWFFDQDSLVLNFFNQDKAHPNTSLPLYIRCYRYIGKVGDFDPVEASTSGGGIGEWQDSVSSFLTPVGNATELNAITNKIITSAYTTSSVTSTSIQGGSSTAAKILIWNEATSKWDSRAPLNGDRFILTTLLPNMQVYRVSEDKSYPGTTINAGSLMEYWDANVRKSGQTGWTVSVPSLGFFTSVDKDSNKVYRYAGLTSSWVTADFEATYSSTDNKDMITNNTFKDGDLALNFGLSAKPSGAGYIEVKVNGVAIKIGNGYVAANKPDAVFAKAVSNIYTVTVVGSTKEILFTNPHGLVAGDQIGFTSSVANIFYSANPTVANPNKIAVPSSLDLSGNPIIYRIKNNATVEVGDRLLWFGSNADYQLEADIVDGSGNILDKGDRISYDFVRS